MTTNKGRLIEYDPDLDWTRRNRKRIPGEGIKVEHNFDEINEKAKLYEERKKELEARIAAYSQRDKLKTREAKSKCIEYLGGKCKRCNHTYPNCVYDFHHRDPKQKEILVSRLMKSNWDVIKRELDKCDLLCSNCHRITHYELNNSEVE